MSAPVAIISFNRPEMLARVLRSLVNNRQLADCGIGSIHLFQDGAVNRYSGRRYAADHTIATCMHTFKTLVPDGVIHLADGNLGVALNYERAETFMFETLRAPVAIFLEDDLVLGVGYTHILMKLIDFALDHAAVGMVSAYGRSPTTPVAIQQAHESRIDHMGHNWGFALTRAHWIERRQHVSPYLELLQGIDYRDRPGEQIAAWRRTHAAGPDPTSQDDCKNLVSLRLGTVRLGTYANFATYIGSNGLHMNEDQFVHAGFHLMRQIPYQGTPLRMPTDRELSDLLFCEVTARHLPQLCRAQTHRLDRSLVRSAFRLFLGREPESEAVVQEKLSHEFPVVLIYDLLTSWEFRDQEHGGLDLSAVVLNRPRTVIDDEDGGYAPSVDQETLRAASRLFLTDEDSIRGIAARSFKSRAELFLALFGCEEFKELYAVALGTRQYFLQSAGRGRCIA